MKQAKRKYGRKQPTLRPTDKWVIGMVNDQGNIEFFKCPTIYTTYPAAVAEAEASYVRYGKSFVVFAKKCVIGPSRPPVMKTEFTA